MVASSEALQERIDRSYHKKRRAAWEKIKKKVIYDGKVYGSVRELAKVVDYTDTYVGHCIRKKKPIHGKLAKYYKGEEDVKAKT